MLGGYIYVHVDSPDLGFPYFNFFKNTLYMHLYNILREVVVSREVVALWCLSSVRGPMVLGCYGGEGQWRKIDIVV